MTLLREQRIKLEQTENSNCLFKRNWKKKNYPRFPHPDQDYQHCMQIFLRKEGRWRIFKTLVSEWPFTCSQCCTFFSLNELKIMQNNVSFWDALNWLKAHPSAYAAGATSGMALPVPLLNFFILYMLRSGQIMFLHRYFHHHWYTTW